MIYFEFLSVYMEICSAKRFNFAKKMFDFIIVGLGIAGWSFVRQLQENKRSFVVFDTSAENSTLASAGVFNPVILKRFTLAWKAAEYLPYALLQYKKYELENTGHQFIYDLPIYRKLTSVAEQNEWSSVSGRPVFEKYMNGISHEHLPGIESPFGFGVMKNTGMIDVNLLLSVLRKQLKKQNLLRENRFDYKRVRFVKNHIEYEGLKAKYIVFTEGFGLKKNPFFGHLPLMGTKGESILVKLSKPVNMIIKSNIFLAPLPGTGLHMAGATYNWTDKSLTPTSEARIHLAEKLQKLYHEPFEIVGQKAGIRPTVKDRRPLLGRHGEYENLFVFNGLGTRGVILAPRLAKMLFEHIVFDIPLPEKVDIKRFG